MKKYFLSALALDLKSVNAFSYYDTFLRAPPEFLLELVVFPLPDVILPSC